MLKVLSFSVFCGRRFSEWLCASSWRASGVNWILKSRLAHSTETLQLVQLQSTLVLLFPSVPYMVIHTTVITWYNCDWISQVIFRQKLQKQISGLLRIVIRKVFSLQCLPPVTGTRPQPLPQIRPLLCEPPGSGGGGEGEATAERRGQQPGSGQDGCRGGRADGESRTDAAGGQVSRVGVYSVDLMAARSAISCIHVLHLFTLYLEILSKYEVLSNLWSLAAFFIAATHVDM